MSSLTCSEITYEGRAGVKLENDRLEVITLYGGGHIACIRLKDGCTVNPLWVPPWPSIEPPYYNVVFHEAMYGGPPAAKLLSSIFGHNICLDHFGEPSEEEAAAGVGVHGEAPVAIWGGISVEQDDTSITMTYGALLPRSKVKVIRKIRLRAGSQVVAFQEEVENLDVFDRPIGWNHHVTTGPPFVEKGVTTYDIPATKSMVFPDEFSDRMRLKQGAEFEWPIAPGADGQPVDLRVFPDIEASSDFTTHLLSPASGQVYFAAANRNLGLLFCYVWNRADFPWLGNWEENYARTTAPWNGKALTRGMEFSTTPFPIPRRKSVDMGTLYDTPTYRWLPARGTLKANYLSAVYEVGKEFPGVDGIKLDSGKLMIQERQSENVIELEYAQA